MTTWLGRYQLGDFVPVVLKTRNASNVITAPTSTSDRSPIGAVFSSSAKVENFRLSPLERSIVTGLFSTRLRLGSSYSAGQYFITVTYTTGSLGYVGSEEFSFEICGSGSANGNITSMTEFLRPEATNVLTATDAGTVYNSRNPY